MDQSSKSSKLPERSKRKANEEVDKLRPKVKKQAVDSGKLQQGWSPSKGRASTLQFPNGTLRITRTPGRHSEKNTISLTDLIDSSQLTSAFIFSFFIAQNELFDHLPFKRNGGQDTSKSRLDVPIYLGRDPNQDPYIQNALTLAGIKRAGKLKKDQLSVVRPHLAKLYEDEYGENYVAVYPWASGCAHSKVLVLIYETFARIAITSANLMDSDTVIGDNHWYIHDLPMLPPGAGAVVTEFETDFLEHLSELNCPSHFIDGTLRGHFDFTNIKVSLVTSKPGTHSGADAERYGLLRLRHLITNLKLPKVPTLEFCAGSIGNINAAWLHEFYHCATGGQVAITTEASAPLPPVSIVYPTRADVIRCYPDSVDGASNMGCHMKWVQVPVAIKEMFHHYCSKDDRRLFHMKLLMGLDKTDPTKKPLYVYIGSANFSASAWGSCKADTLKLTKISNYECGVLIPGDLILSLLETDKWEDLVPYVRPAVPYDLQRKEEKPWNDPRWVTGAPSGSGA